MNLTERLIQIYLHGDRVGVTHVKVPVPEMQTMIRDAAKLEASNAQLPWETGADYNERMKGRLIDEYR